ncbi:MAG: hypothetical protein ACYTGV_09555 [Planctomycetota bacterium]|jgi:hypothetical protein
MQRAAISSLFVFGLIVAGCNGSTSNGNGQQDPVPDFALMDVNPTSTTFNQAVSPRDYSGQVTGWYFGSAT